MTETVQPSTLPAIGWVMVPRIGTTVRADHPQTCLNPEPTFVVAEVRAESSGSGFAVRGENTCWFGIGMVRPAASPQPVAGNERSVMEQALAALEGVTREAERNICPHEDTYRGGAIWEICRDCGAKWADDKGGRPEFKEPVAITRAHDAITALRAALAGEAPASNQLSGNSGTLAGGEAATQPRSPGVVGGSPCAPIEPAGDPEEAATQPAADPKLTITLRQAEHLLAFFGGHDCEVTVARNLPDHQPGLYAWCTEYPEEGGEYLGPTEVDDELAANGRTQPAAQSVKDWVEKGMELAERMGSFYSNSDEGRKARAALRTHLENPPSPAADASKGAGRLSEDQKARLIAGATNFDLDLERAEAWTFDREGLFAFARLGAIVLSSVGTPAGAPAVTEREAFEACAREMGWHLGRFPSGTYNESHTEAKWSGWQARASLGATPAPAVTERATFEAWYHEVENFGLRCERLEDIDSRDEFAFVLWQAGRASLGATPAPAVTNWDLSDVAPHRLAEALSDMSEAEGATPAQSEDASKGAGQAADARAAMRAALREIDPCSAEAYTDEQIDALVAAAAGVMSAVLSAGTTGWQPISTRPMDGTRYLAATADGHVRLVRQAAKYDRLPLMDTPEPWPDLPAHWMPLPDAPVAQSEDTAMLDYLDERNRAKNKKNGTVYGWRLSENHNRIALEDHNYPALSVRAAIRAAMKASTGGAK